MESSSNLLRTLQQLNDSAWADTLIPKLKENSSAGSFALACKQLRQLCHGTQHKLRLKGADCSDEAATALIPQHFPSCTEVEFTVEDCHDATRLQSALPSLARLQHLSMLEFRLTDSGAGSEYCAPLLLELVLLQLSGLQRLQLSINASWQDMAWQALGRATQLTSLAVVFDEGVGAAVSLEHLSALSSLSSLASLKVLAFDMEPVQQYNFLHHLTGLTSLYLPLGEQHEGLASIGSCTRLKDLTLVVGWASPFTEAECAAIAQLVQLTRLCTSATAGSHPHFLSALRLLSQLVWLGVDGLSHASLPCLAGLTKLTEVRGAWQVGGDNTSNTAQLMCSSVVGLGGEGPIPFAAFPNLKAALQLDTWEPASVKALAEHCKQVKQLYFYVGFTAASLSSDSPVGERTAAIQALAALHLTGLGLSANDNTELAVVAAIKQLKRLYVMVPAGSNCTLGGLLQLIRLQGLQCLTLELRSRSLSRQDAQLMLCGMQHVGRLRVLASREQLDVFRAAHQAAQAAQLAVPAAVVFGPLP